MGLGVGFDEPDGRCEEGEEDLDCWVKNLRTKGISVRPAVVLILFVLIPSPVRVSLAGALGTSSLGVFLNYFNLSHLDKSITRVVLKNR